VRKLQRSGYSVYFRPTDERLGCVKEEEIIDVMSNSRVYIILLSDDYLSGSEEPWSGIEWRHAWNKFKQESKKHNIIIINYDFKRPSEFPKGILRALLNLGIPLDFANHYHRLHHNICARVGTPNSRYRAVSAGFNNRNIKFDPRLIPEYSCTRNRCEVAGKEQKTHDNGSSLNYMLFILPARILKDTNRKRRFFVRKNRKVDYVCKDFLEY
jgi:hypothetical protein